MAKQSERYYFKAHYQKGDKIISEPCEGVGYLPISKIIETILKLVIKVRDEEGYEIGGKVALEGLRCIFKFAYNSDMDQVGTGGSVSKFLNRKNAKNALDRSERFDYEFLGNGGRDDESNEVITQFIKFYKENIRGQMKSK